MAGGRRLKNYDLYVKSIRTYAKAIGVKIIYSEEKDEGAYDHEKKQIIIDQDLSDSFEIASLLHELGHNLDDSSMGFSNQTVLAKAYVAVNSGGRIGKVQIENVIECEVRAWHYAKTLAKILRIPLGKWYYDDRKRCLANYRRGRNQT